MIRILRLQFIRLFVLLSMIAAGLPAQAQSEGDDAYDPFADYSEFDEASDEEADINFFRNGRFFSIGVSGGLRSFTENMAKVYSMDPTYGLFVTYFTDLRSAFQVSFLTGDHAFEMNHPSESITGNVSMTFVNFDYKYFISSQNVTRGLADLNPYIVGGISQVYRTLSISADSGGGRDATMGLQLGAGVEIPLSRKKSFLGIQGTYRYFTFKDENKIVVLPSTGIVTSTKINGDSLDLLLILGSNF